MAEADRRGMVTVAFIAGLLIVALFGTWTGSRSVTADGVIVLVTLTAAGMLLPGGGPRRGR